MYIHGSGRCLRLLVTSRVKSIVHYCLMWRLQPYEHADGIKGVVIKLQVL